MFVVTLLRVVVVVVGACVVTLIRIRVCVRVPGLSMRV